MKREEETGEEITFLFEEKKLSGWESHLKLTVAAAPVKGQQFANHAIYKGRTSGSRGSCKLKGSRSRQCAWGCCFYVCFWVSLMESIFKMYKKNALNFLVQQFDSLWQEKSLSLLLPDLFVGAEVGKLPHRRALAGAMLWGSIRCVPFPTDWDKAREYRSVAISRVSMNNSPQSSRVNAELRNYP